MAHYSFITIWKFDHPVDAVWEAINAAEDYPLWWPNILGYRCLTPDNPREVGAKGERVVRGLLPYSLSYTTTITQSERPRELAFDAAGDLKGDGKFVFQPNGNRTVVTIYWNVETSGKWLNRLAPLLKWMFAWNHSHVMRRGERGLADWLDARAAIARSNQTNKTN
jgi:uncharacterized protein YndB with AHSA1/START domain